MRVVTNRNLVWYEVLDERTAFKGGIHNKVIRKILKMMNYYEFINDWSELGQKGQMEKEFLADYDDQKLQRMDNVIRLVKTVGRFEQNYLKSDPLELPAFYRKILDKSFHGTGYLFERIDSDLVFILLSITANLSRGEIINFNPLLVDVKTAEIDDRVKRIEQEARGINVRYADFDVISQLGEQLHRHGSSFVLGTGFQLKVAPETQALEIAYMDVDKAINRLESLSKEIAGAPISEIPVEKMENLESLFSDLESFFQSHLRFIEETKYVLKVPGVQKRWFQKVHELRQYLRSNFLAVFFSPENVYTNFDLIYRYAPSVLDFILPELTGLQEQAVPWHLHMTSPVIHYIMAATKKLQALITQDKEIFQDVHYLHRLAQREFGPMATGTVGVSDSQIKDLERIVDKLSRNRPLFDALIKSLIFQDLGRLPALREKYENDINPAELAQASALFIEKEGIAQGYDLDERGKNYFVLLVRHHSLWHHILRGEFSPAALKNILELNDKDFFDAFFVFSFIMLSAIRNDLILEDLADQLFKAKILLEKDLDGKASFQEKI
ncbi:MAG: hypothetical protein JRJ00_15855 [Deltaproteobacteria bacterium]|nr:hypothetical protein [Deltaproteobacteria bacterium]